MNFVSKERKGTTVRLTEQAHLLLLGKVDDYRGKGHTISMKDIASEAIFLLIRQDDIYKEHHAHIKRLNEASIKLQERFRIHLFISTAVGTIAGIVIGVIL